MSYTKACSESLTMAVEYDNDTGMISLNDDWVEAEFRAATYQAVEDNVEAFMFHGYEVETATAIDVVRAMFELKSYH